MSDDYGAYQIYYGENDKRNFNGIYKKENELQDVDYAYVLVTIFIALTTYLCTKYIK